MTLSDVESVVSDANFNELCNGINKNESDIMLGAYYLGENHIICVVGKYEQLKLIVCDIVSPIKDLIQSEIAVNRSDDGVDYSALKIDNSKSTTAELTERWENITAKMHEQTENKSNIHIGE